LAKSKRREIIKERHKQEIIESALHLFGTKGYKNTTMEEIAEHAQFSKGAIYFYFKSKKQLLDEILTDLFDKIQSLAEEAKKLRGNAKDRLRFYASEIIKFFLTESKFSFHVMMQAIMQMETDEMEMTRNYVLNRLSNISKILTDIIKADIKSGKLKNIDPNLVVMAFNGMLRDVIYGCLTNENISANPDQIVDSIIEIIFDGISKNKKEAER
jgi:AcrR family transcriptional regulator